MHIRSIYLYAEYVGVRITVDNDGVSDKVYIGPAEEYKSFVMNGAPHEVLDYVEDIAFWFLTTDYFKGDLSKRKEAILLAKKKFKTWYYD